MPLFDVLGNFPVWSLATYPSTLFTDIKTKCVLLLSGSCVGKEIASSVAAAVSDCCVCLDGLPRLDLLVVDLVPCFFCFMCPISVASSTATYLLIVSAVKPGHPLRYPAFAASASVILGWDPKITLAELQMQDTSKGYQA